MTAVLLGLLIAGLAVALCFVTVWARWRWRLARRRRERLIERQCWDDELERQCRRLRLRVQ